MNNRDRGVFFGMMFAGTASLALLPGAARADVVFPPPNTCPGGTEPATCHGGPHCRPLICATDADCKMGAACMDRPFCVRTISCAGKLPPDADPSMYNQQAADATCPGNSSCDAGATCSTLKVCVSTASTSTGSSSGSSSSEASSGSGPTGVIGGCGCRAAGAHAGVAELPLLALGALGLGLRARRRRDQRSAVSRQRRA